MIGTRESVIQYVFRLRLFFFLFVTKSLGNIFEQKGKRIENRLSEEEKGYKTELMKYVKRRVYDLKLSIVYTY